MKNSIVGWALTLGAPAIVLLAQLAHAMPGNPRDCMGSATTRERANQMLLTCKLELALRPTTENKSWIYYQMGLLYQFDGRLDEAVESYTRAIGWFRQWADPLLARADTFQKLGRSAEAKADYDAAAKLSTGYPGGRCLDRGVRGYPLDLALEDCNKSLWQEPDNWRTYDSRCLVRYRMGDYAGAIADCTVSLKSRPRLSSSLYLRGLAKLKSGDAEGGNADIAAAKDADDRIVETYAYYGVTP